MGFALIGSSGGGGGGSVDTIFNQHPADTSNWKHYELNFNITSNIVYKDVFQLLVSGGTLAVNQNPVADAFGHLEFSSGSSNYCFVGTGAKSMNFGQVETRAYMRIQLSAVPDVTDEAFVFFGFHQDSIGRDIAVGAKNRVGWVIERSANTTNWVCDSLNASATQQDSGVALSTDALNLELHKNAAGTQVLYYANGVLVHTGTANLPSAGDDLGICFSAHRVAGNGQEGVITKLGYSVKVANGTWASWSA